ncbi:MAG: hypothetical protein JW940_32775 [Polyangiaceae bacterium]|nr:hypothetical protein [Polyangiaceae bacterium]
MIEVIGGADRRIASCFRPNGFSRSTGIETLTSWEYFVTKLLVHQGTLYYATAGNQPLDGDLGEIKRIDVGTAEPPRVLAVEQAWPRDLAVDGAWLYWTGGLYSASGYVRRVAR